MKLGMIINIAAGILLAHYLQTNSLSQISDDLLQHAIEAGLVLWHVFCWAVGPLCLLAVLWHAWRERRKETKSAKEFDDLMAHYAAMPTESE